jgi:hypothetical protein
MEATKESTAQIKQIMNPQNKPVQRVLKSLQEAMVTMDMSRDELIKYHETKYKSCYGCKAKEKNYKKTCDCYKKKKCSGCHKLIKQCTNESIHCDDQTDHDYI